MAPPQLTADAPVANIREPVAIDLFPALRNKARVLFRECFSTASCERFRLHKPLGGEQGLHWHLAPIGVGNAMPIVLHLDQQPLLIEGCHHSLTRLKAIHPFEAPRLGIHRAVLAHHRDLSQPVTLPNREVIGVMSWCDLDAASAELLLHVIVGNDRDLTTRKRQIQGLTNQMGVALIAGVHRHRRVAEHGFWARCGHFEMALTTAERIAEMPEITIHFLHLHLQVTHRGTRSRTPIH